MSFEEADSYAARTQKLIAAARRYARAWRHLMSIAVTTDSPQPTQALDECKKAEEALRHTAQDWP